ncbi:MAG TPA: family 16 glycosylhydrolase [Trebonia sp.]|nr:family 16 glycosylhydrolase [Trebonia sp.]
MTGTDRRTQDPAPRRSVGATVAGVGLLAVACAIGAGVLLTEKNSPSTTAGDATTTITKLGAAAVGREALSISSPAIIAQAIASGPVQPTGSPTKRPKTVGPPVVLQPTTPGITPESQNGPDPSGQSPLATLSGFTPDYVQEFTGDSIPANWGAYSNVPGGESAQTAQWVPGMCTFSGGEAHFTASGIDSCGLNYYGTPQEYGAWFARMKGDDDSGLSFSDIFLLWPANNQWPPEIDIYEDSGGNRSGTTATLHNTVGNACGSSPTGACLQPYEQTNASSGGVSNTGSQWHTYGVEWTPSGVTWLIDGHVIFTAPASQVKSPAQQPALPMNMVLQSQNLQGSGAPSTRETLTVDWVEEFSWNS